MSGTPGSFVDGLTAAVRENPLAAALIGGGALWLLIGNDKLKNAASSLTAAAAPLPTQACAVNAPLLPGLRTVTIPSGIALHECRTKPREASVRGCATPEARLPTSCRM